MGRGGVISSDETINRNQVSEISGVFPESEKVNLISDLSSDYSYLFVQLLKEWHNDNLKSIDQNTYLLSNACFSFKSTNKMVMRWNERE